MLTQVKNVRFWMQAKVGQRGAEMVEYAIVLACVAAVGVVFYSNSGSAENTLSKVLGGLWSSIADNADKAGQAPAAGGGTTTNP